MERSVFIKTTAFGGYDKADVDSAFETLYSRLAALETKLRDNEALLEGLKQGRDEKSVSEDILSENSKLLAEAQAKCETLAEKESRLTAELSEKDEKIAELSEKLESSSAELEKANKRLEQAGLSDSAALSKVFIEAQKSADMLVEDAKKQAEALKADSLKLTENIIIEANNKAAQIVYNAEKSAAETEARSRSGEVEIKAASSNLKASMLENIKDIGGVLSKFKELLSELEKSGLEKIASSEELLKGAESTLTAGGIPQFTLPEAIAPVLPEAPKLIKPDLNYSASESSAKSDKMDVSDDLEKLMNMAMSLENGSKEAPAPEKNPSADKDIDLDALAKMAESL